MENASNYKKRNARADAEKSVSYQEDAEAGEDACPAAIRHAHSIVSNIAADCYCRLSVWAKERSCEGAYGQNRTKQDRILRGGLRASVGLNKAVLT